MSARGSFVKLLCYFSAAGAVLSACGGDEAPAPAPGDGASGSAGKGGSAGSAGKGGTKAGGSAGASAGTSGASGTGGSAGAAGAGSTFGGGPAAGQGGGAGAAASTGGAAGNVSGGAAGAAGTQGGVGGGAAKGGTGGAAAGQGGGGFSAGQGGTGGSTCATKCTADRRGILDCANKPVMTCAPQEACGDTGTCVAACTGALERETTNGCDFYAAHPPTFRGDLGGTRGSCFVAMLANTWTTPATVRIAVGGGATIDGAPFTRIPKGSGKNLTYEPLADGTIPPGTLGLVFLNDYDSKEDARIACPVPAAFHEETADLLGTARGKAFHVTTDVPVVAYDIFPWGGAKSFVAGATQLVPTPTWGANFVTLDAWEAYSTASIVNNNLPFTQIVASEDETEVRFRPSAKVVGGPGVAPSTPDEPATYMLAKGEILQLSQTDRLAGSVVQSNRPVGVWGGSGCALILTSQAACDSIHQAQLPVRKQGFAYVGARFPDRTAKEPLTPYTMVGMVNGTELTYDPKPNGAPTKLEEGQIARFFTDKPFSVQSQDGAHPFSLTGYMTGCASVTSKEACEFEKGDPHGGDPEMVAMVTPAQYLDSYLFVADPTYANTSLVFVRQAKVGGSFDDVALDCAGTIAGWEPVGTQGLYQVARVYLTKDGSDVGTCSTGAHTAKSASPFGLTVWGWDVAVSYGFPAGFSTRDINAVIVPIKD